MAVTYEIDFERLVADSQRNGINPLTVIDAGGMNAYMVERPGAAAPATPGAPATPAKPVPVPNAPSQGGHLRMVAPGKMSASSGSRRVSWTQAQRARVTAGRDDLEVYRDPSTGSHKLRMTMEAKALLGGPRLRSGVNQLATSGKPGVQPTAGAGASGTVTMPVVNGISGPWAAQGQGPLPVGKPNKLIPIMIGGTGMVHDLGWSNAEDFETRYGELVAEVYGIGVMAADVMKASGVNTQKLGQDFQSAPTWLANGAIDFARYLDSRRADAANRPQAPVAPPAPASPAPGRGGSTPMHPAGFSGPGNGTFTTGGGFGTRGSYTTGGGFSGAGTWGFIGAPGPRTTRGGF